LLGIKADFSRGMGVKASIESIVAPHPLKNSSEMKRNEMDLITVKLPLPVFYLIPKRV
jgi:hypothetical protein